MIERSPAQTLRFAAGMAIVLTAVFWGGCRRAADRPPVVLISIDTCRADHLGCFGDPRPITPNLDALAEESLIFTNAFTPVPITLPAHSSLMTGQYPLHHGVRDNLDYVLPDACVTLAEILTNAGYAATGFAGAFVLDSRFGIAQGFGEYDDRLDAGPHPGVTTINERRGDEISDLACRWLESRDGDDFFLFLHYFDPHTRYDPPAPYAQRFPDEPYAGEVAFTDACIGRVIDRLKKDGLYDRSLIIVAGDHGESLGEHGESAHDYFIYQATLRVPLIIKLPGSTQGRAIHRNASLVDVMPTLLARLSIPIPPGIDGRDLLSDDLDDHRDLYCESLTPTRYGAGPLLGIIRNEWKLIESSRPELYNLKDDPAEARNRIAETARAAALRSGLRAMAQAGEVERPAAPDAQARVNEEARERLQSLGYVATQAVDETLIRQQNLPDPKTRITFHEGFQATLGLIETRDFSGARARCRAMLADHPEIADGHILLGDIEFQAGDHKAAAESYTRYLEQATRRETQDPPSDYRRKTNRARAHYNLANALAEGGDLSAAITHYREALREDPQHLNARYNLGLTLAETGDISGSRSEFEAVLARDPENVPAHRDLATALLALGRPAEAMDHLNAALRLQPDDAPTHLRLGDLLISQNRLADAAQHYDAVLSSHPDSPEAYLKSARIFVQLADRDRAFRRYEDAVTRFPNWWAAADEYARLLATHPDPRYRDGEKAILLATRACEGTRHSDPRLLDTLAASYAAVGKFDESVKLMHRALSIAQSGSAPATFVALLQDHLSAYRQRSPVTDG